MNILIFVSVENVCVYLAASCKNMAHRVHKGDSENDANDFRDYCWPFLDELYQAFE